MEGALVPPAPMRLACCATSGGLINGVPDTRRNFECPRLVKGRMKQFSVVLLVLVSAGCSALPLTGEDDADDFRVPLVCGPEHKQLPCNGGVEEGVGYRFNLLTHCGIEWAYFGGRYWLPKPKVDTPSHWANIETGTMLLERP